MKNSLTLADKAFRFIRLTAVVVFSMFAMVATFTVIFMSLAIKQLTPEQLEQLTPVHFQEMVTDISSMSLNTSMCFVLIYFVASVIIKQIQRRQTKVDLARTA
ncbi:hypothetical protein ACPV3S_12880 [Photobacterium damselae]|uniref:hypothetical protein n=1 Tax=Photobacterium damselae TaxID=38293 RepID=UPI0040692B8A